MSTSPAGADQDTGARYSYAKCLCGCQWWLVLDVIEHRVVGADPSSWKAGKVADHLNRGLPVYVELEAS